MLSLADLTLLRSIALLHVGQEQDDFIATDSLVLTSLSDCNVHEDRTVMQTRGHAERCHGQTAPSHKEGPSNQNFESGVLSQNLLIQGSQSLCQAVTHPMQVAQSTH